MGPGALLVLIYVLFLLNKINFLRWETFDSMIRFSPLKLLTTYIADSLLVIREFVVALIN